MIHNLKKFLLVDASIVLLLLVTAYIRFYPNHVELPRGCDEFGYLQLAEAFSAQAAFDEHTSRAFLPELLSYLDRKGYAPREYTWIIAPHAYHLDQSTGKIINQYPPGTSVLMSFLPKELRQFYFPMLVFTLLFLLGFVAAYLMKLPPQQTQILVLLLLGFSLYAMTSAPLLKELTAVNSVAPSVAFLIIGGVLLPAYPLAGSMFIAFSVNFRLANVLLWPALVLYCVFREPFRTSMSLSYIKRAAVVSFILLFTGLCFYFVYAAQLLGNPLASTYSSVDQAGVDADRLLDNLAYYFDFRQWWFVLNVLLFVLMSWLRFTGRLAPALYRTLALMLVTVYIYFITHNARTPYYPYAPALVMTGVLFTAIINWVKWKPAWLLGLRIALVIPLLAVCIDRWPKFRQAVAEKEMAETDRLQQCFTSADVMWGELKTGTVEYATAVPAMRYFWGSEPLRADIMHWLLNNNLKQVILFNDLQLAPEELKAFLERYDLPYVTENSPCGPLIIIDR
jgi:hypothetical protein